MKKSRNVMLNIPPVTLALSLISCLVSIVYGFAGDIDPLLILYFSERFGSGATEILSGQLMATGNAGFPAYGFFSPVS